MKKTEEFDLFGLSKSHHTDIIEFGSVKKCNKCGKIKSLNEFQFRTDYGKYRTKCKICEKESKKIYQEIKVCNLCGKNYRGYGKKFCSKECAYKSGVIRRKKRGKEVSCEQCGKKTYKYQCHLKAHKNHFCSVECRHKWLSENKTGVEKVYNCLGCGKEVVKYLTDSGLKNKNSYCSMSCYSKSEHPQNRTGEYLSCDLCGKDHWVRKHNKKEHKHHFCSVECYDNWQRTHRVERKCHLCGKVIYRVKSSFRFDKAYCSSKCMYACPSLKLQLIQMNQKQQDTKINKLEKRGYKIIEDMGLKHDPQYLIANKFIVDSFISKFNLIIQFDGDYWHGNPKKFPVLTERQKKRKRIDKSQNAYFKKCGYSVFRIWESEMDEFEDRLKEIIEEINK